jgi:hypothetical protein
LLRQVKAAIGSANSDQAVFGVLAMDELISDSVTEPRFNAFLTCAFTLLAVAMTAAGMHSCQNRRGTNGRVSSRMPSMPVRPIHHSVF